jgi:cyanophycin synthetase
MAFSIEIAGQGLRVVQRAVYRGPHIYGDTLMIRIRVDLGFLETFPTSVIPSFPDALLEALPSLSKHACSRGHEGGFVERLREGTWLGHVIEHVAIELQSLAGARVALGKTRSVKNQPGVYDILFEYRDEEVGLLAGWLALQLVDGLLPPPLRGVSDIGIVHEGPAIVGQLRADQAVDMLKAAQARYGLGPTTRSLLEEAEAQGIPALRLDDHSLLQLGWGARQKKLRASITSDTPFVAVEAAGDKQLTRSLLQKAGIPAPEGVVIRDVEDAVVEAKRLGWPVVVKPLDANHGKGVTTEICDEAGVRAAFELAQPYSSLVIVEQHYKGADHRILVVDGDVVAVAERVPACVVGDGARSVEALVEEVNRDPRRGEGHERVMTRIRLDARAAAWLARSGRSFASVPAKGERVFLQPTANMSTGGVAIDRTDVIHPDNACIAVRAALTLGLDIAGVDFMCPDISQSVRKTGGGVIEVNAAPGFRMHLQPAEGRPRNVARPVIRMLFPYSQNGRIPVFAITGTNGKSTTVRMLAHILKQAGYRVGMTTTSGVYINGDRIIAADASGPRSARAVLRDPMVDAAVLEIARGGLLREGLAFDKCDVGAVTNVQEDHLGLKGIDTIEDLAWVKSVVVENVKHDGISVLNADDPMSAGMRRRATGNLAFISLHGEAMPEFMREHVENGGLAIALERKASPATIVVYQDGRRRPLIAAAEIPATLGGLAIFNIANAMTAACMAIGHGLDVSTVRLALATFGTAFEQNPGRLNIFDGHGFRVILDYAHNVHGLRALGEMLHPLRASYPRQIGMIAIPGDRRDEDIRAMGEMAARTFDEIVVREDPDTRGRTPGDIIRLLREGVLRTGFPAEQLHVGAEELNATVQTLRLARPGDLVVLCPTQVDRVWEQVIAFRPHPAENPPSAKPNGHGGEMREQLPARKDQVHV